MKIRRSRKAAATVAIGASVLTGGALGAAFVTPLGAGAQDSTATTAATDATAATGSTATTDQAPARALPDFVSSTLDRLVADGTLNQTQRDAVAAALLAAQPADGPGHGRGGPDGDHGHGPNLDVAATALGVSADDLRTQLDAGSTIAQVAQARGVDVQTVVDALLADMQSHLDQGVADGKLTQAEADARKADAARHATDMVNGVRPQGPPPGAPADGATRSAAAPDGQN